MKLKSNLAAPLTAFVMLQLVGCYTRGDNSAARDTYNDAVQALSDSKWQEAIDGLLAANDDTGPDPELRYRAAFDLGVAYAKLSVDLEVADPNAALDALRSAASWFRKALRLRNTDDDARKNLERVLNQTRLLADRINKGDNGLKARLDRLIEDQRGLRDNVRQLVSRADAEGVLADPRPLRDEFNALATRQRTLASDASVVLDLAADERALLENKAKEERTPQDEGRIVQLTNIEHYLGSGRMALGDARRMLRKLRGERAHLRSDKGLQLLKRARDQLLDPIVLLRHVAHDQQQTAQYTAALEKLSHGTIRVGGDADSGATGATRAQVIEHAPPWLTAEHLAARQQDEFDRTSELAARLEAFSKAPPGEAPADPKTARLIEDASQAAPFVSTAAESMRAAHTALGSNDLPGAGEAQMQALRALAEAIERFSELRGLIDLAYATQQQIVSLLTPPASPGEGTHATDVPGEKLTAAERLKRLVGETARNIDRLVRMQTLISEKRSQAQAQTQQQAQGQAPGQPSQPGPEQQEQLQAALQRLERAEQLRASAATSLDALAASLTQQKQTAGQSLEQARAADKDLEELRRLFFNMVEHLKQLMADQSETRDQTASTAQEDDDARASALGPLADRQAQHKAMADALANAFEKQADQAATASTTSATDPKAAQAKEAADRLARAAPEVREAATAVTNAATIASAARDQALSMSVDLEPLLADQKSAIEHIQRALEIMQPPKNDNKNDKQDKKDKQQDPKDQQKKKEDKVSQQEAARKLQAIREREAERQRKRNKQRPSRRESVARDW